MSDSQDSINEIPLAALLDQPLPEHKPAQPPRKIYQPIEEEILSALDDDTKMTMLFQQQGFRAWYDSLIDWIIMNPDKPLYMAAAELNKGKSTIYMLHASDMFQARLAQRRTEHSKKLSDRIHEKMTGIALETLDELHNRVKDNPAKVPFGALLELNNSVLDKLGYGAKPLPGTGPTTNVTVTVDAGSLREAQQLMRQVQTINAEATEVK